MVNSEKVLVLGLGNVLMGDDAAGLYALKLLHSRYVIPEQVSLLDGGTAGMVLPSLMEGYGAVLILDTVRTGDAPGTVCRFDSGALRAASRTASTTPHDPSLNDALLLAELNGDACRELVLIGVVPKQTQPGIGLSPAVLDAMEHLLEAARMELSRLGMTVTPRETPLQPDLWWERQP